MVAQNETLSINTSCHRTYCSHFTKYYFSLLREPLLFLPVITVQRRAKGETETLQVSKHQPLDTSTLPTLHISLLCTCAPLGPLQTNASTCTNTHNLNAYLCVALVHIHACMHRYKPHTCSHRSAAPSPHSA